MPDLPDAQKKPMRPPVRRTFMGDMSWYSIDKNEDGDRILVAVSKNEEGEPGGPSVRTVLHADFHWADALRFANDILTVFNADDQDGEYAPGHI